MLQFLASLAADAVCVRWRLRGQQGKRPREGRKITLFFKVFAVNVRAGGTTPVPGEQLLQRGAREDIAVWKPRWDGERSWRGTKIGASSCSFSCPLSGAFLRTRERSSRAGGGEGMRASGVLEPAGDRNVGESSGTAAGGGSATVEFLPQALQQVSANVLCNMLFRLSNLRNLFLCVAVVSPPPPQ